MSAVIPGFIAKGNNKLISEVSAYAVGLVILSLLAQISISLPWSPVPITGQTFGVGLIALSWGRVRGFAIVLSYLFLGFIGLPVFAQGLSGLSLGPTTGYLFGMAISALLVGTLADRGFGRKFSTAMLALVCGSLVTFACGLLVLSFFIPKEALLMSGLLPFLPGDLIKNTLAAMIVSKAERFNE